MWPQYGINQVRLLIDTLTDNNSVSYRTSVLPQMGNTDGTNKRSNCRSKGYLKVDICILAKGETPKLATEEGNDDDEIEG